jgi:hypothetical protein
MFCKKTGERQAQQVGEPEGAIQVLNAAIKIFSMQ